MLPQSPPPPSPDALERVIKCSEQKDAARARKLAVKQMENGRLDKAEGCARAVLRIRGDTASAADWEQLGIILNRRGKMQGAVNALRNAVARDDHVKPPADVRVERRLELANALLGIARSDDAMEQYRECVMIAPHNVAPYINGGNVHLYRGNYAAAEQFYRTALQLDPANFDAIVNLGALMSGTARGEQAVEEYRRALALDPGNVDALSNMGSLQMNMGDVRGALMTFEQAFKIDGQRAPLCYNLANAYMANNQVQEAIDKNERAISLDPSMLSAKCSLASLFAMQGRYEEAISAAEQAATASLSPQQAASSEGMWRLTSECFLLALQIETGQWGADTERKLERMVSAFVSDILGASQRRAMKDMKSLAEDDDDERRMRLNAMTTCLVPSRAFYILGMDHHQALITAIYAWQQAEQRAKALPRLMPSSTQLFWEPGPSRFPLIPLRRAPARAVFCLRVCARGHRARLSAFVALWRCGVVALWLGLLLSSSHHMVTWSALLFAVTWSALCLTVLQIPRWLWATSLWGTRAMDSRSPTCSSSPAIPQPTTAGGWRTATGLAPCQIAAMLHAKAPRGVSLLCAPPASIVWKGTGALLRPWAARSVLCGRLPDAHSKAQTARSKALGLTSAVHVSHASG